MAESNVAAAVPAAAVAPNEEDKLEQLKRLRDVLVSIIKKVEIEKETVESQKATTDEVNTQLASENKESATTNTVREISKNGELIDTEVKKINELLTILDVQSQFSKSNVGKIVFNVDQFKEKIEEIKQYFEGNYREEERKAVLLNLEPNFFGYIRTENIVIGINLHYRYGKLTEQYIFWFPASLLENLDDQDIDKIYELLKSEDEIGKIVDAELKKRFPTGGSVKSKKVATRKRSNKKHSNQTQRNH